MARPAADYPTELELKILKILWESSPSRVREVRQALAAQGRRIAHTSVITTLNTMVRKKYLKRSKEGTAFLFSPRVNRQDVSHRMVGDLVDRVFDGSAAGVMLTLFDSARIDAEELKELRRLIQQKTKEQSG